ncbi:hypothetical protein C0Q70_01214 [Pomacea canaliculata]|uniref:Uncharacterized protein n=1 Tax=Pomacea canaliculata TaxID=400727 RepID=A0A2T7PYW5_POMCA|nr:hypothetical protein C0Q70_01214 [Pomacea canaliculata]
MIFGDPDACTRCHAKTHEAHTASKVTHSTLVLAAILDRCPHTSSGNSEVSVRNEAHQTVLLSLSALWWQREIARQARDKVESIVHNEILPALRNLTDLVQGGEAALVSVPLTSSTLSTPQHRDVIMCHVHARSIRNHVLPPLPKSWTVEEDTCLSPSCNVVVVDACWWLTAVMKYMCMALTRPGAQHARFLLQPVYRARVTSHVRSRAA